MHVVGGCVRQWWREARRRMWWRTHGMGWNAGYVWCCCSSLAIRIVGNTLTHTYTHTHRYWARHSMVRTHSGAWIVSGRYTQWSVGRAVVHMDTRSGSFSGWSMGCTHDTQTHRQIVSRRMWTVYIYVNIQTHDGSKYRE